MSDDPSNPNSNGQTNGESEGTILGDNAGVYIPSDEKDAEDGGAPDEVPADFGSFIVSLGTNCMINLGRIEHPETGTTDIDLESAKHTIEIIAMLQDKTEGNVDAEEQKLVESLLHDLRAAYAQEKKKYEQTTVKN